MKDTIVAYEGGGWDGCIWEPNFAFFDKDGVLHDAGSSGRAGLFKNGKPQQAQTVEDLGKLVESEEWAKETSPSFYPFTDEGVREMFDKYRVDFCLYVIKKINVDMGTDQGVPCGVCKEMVDPCDCLLPDGWSRGDGGIGTIHELAVCSDCYCTWECVKCNEFAGEGGIDGNCLCECCAKAVRESIPEVEVLELAIAKGKRQLEELIALNPSKADKYREDHKKAAEEMENEIHDLVETALGN